MSPTRPMTACSCGATETRTTEGGGIGASSAAAIAADKSQAHVLIEKGGEDSLKRLMLLIAAGSLWLFLAAVPVFADGGPHVSAINNGTGNGGATLAADSCAGCHRAHTAQGEFLLKDSGGIATCTSCHGASGLGATTDVENGIQYVLGTSPIRTGTTLGYLRSGGFVTARIGSGEAYRLAYLQRWQTTRQLAKVPVRTAGSQPVTSAHLPNVGGVIEAADGVAWGNGPNSATAYAGPAVDVECVTCHNPHGNGAYRILNPIPIRTQRAPTCSSRQRRRHRSPTRRPPPQATTATTPSSRRTAAPGRSRRTRWPPSACPQRRATTSGDGSRGTPRAARPTTRRTASPGPSTRRSRPGASRATRATSAQGWDVETPDAIYKYRHTSNATSRNCITCHVAHGSNAQMPGYESANMEYPGGALAPVGNSRLLKVDNRGTCQLCHDPTGTIVPGQAVGPVPAPLLP